MRLLTQDETRQSIGGLCPFCVSSYLLFVACASTAYTGYLNSTYSYCLLGGTFMLLSITTYTYREHLMEIFFDDNP